jgi:endo-1,4-beta-xylanase
MKVRAHTLVWHEANPKWVLEGEHSPEQLADILHDHISTVAGHFRGQVISWDVVNEAFDDKGLIQEQGPWPAIDQAPGRSLAHGDYLRDAYRWAREADPDALLFYNDYGAEELNEKSDAVYRFIKGARADGVPIQGIGFQMHIDTESSLSEESLRANFKRFGDLGLVIHVTEMDVGIPKNKKKNKGPTPKQLAAQAELYRKVMRVCRETPQCQAFLTWGLTDKYNWIDEGSDMTSPLLLDAQYQPKPAYRAIQDLLREP